MFSKEEIKIAFIKFCLQKIRGDNQPFRTMKEIKLFLEESKEQCYITQHLIYPVHCEQVNAINTRVIRASFSPEEEAANAITKMADYLGFVISFQNPHDFYYTLENFLSSSNKPTPHFFSPSIPQEENIFETHDQLIECLNDLNNGIGFDNECLLDFNSYLTYLKAMCDEYEIKKNYVSKQ